MTRRLLFSAALLASVAQAESLHNQTALTGNAFHDLWVRWAESFNRAKSIDAREIAAWNPMPKAFRNLEHVRLRWIRGRA